MLVPFLYILLLASCIQLSYQSDVEVALLDHLFNRSVYSKLARPIDDHNNAMEVEFGISLQAIDYVDLEKSTLSVQLWLNYEWKDHKLSWTPGDFGQISSIRLPTDMLWVPDILLYNSANEDFFNLVHHTDVVVYSDGTCSWVPAGIHVVACAMDPAWFPFDEHMCNLKFGSWTYDGSKVNVTSRSDSVDLSTYSMHRLWELVDESAKRRVVRYDCCPEPYIDITFSFRFRRRSFHEGLLVFFPPSLLSLMSLLSFSLPVTCGERITMGALQLISLGMTWIYLSENVTPQAYSVTLTDVYYCCMLVGCFVSFSLTVLVHKMYYKATAMPNLLRSLVTVLAKVTCFPDTRGYRDLQGQPRASFDGDSTNLQINKDDVDNRAAWMRASHVLDRFFFFLFLVFFILSCVIIFASVPR